MWFFTLPLARLVGETGRVIAIDIQPKMMAVLATRSLVAGLSDRVERRLGVLNHLMVEDPKGKVDLAPALYMLHEISNLGNFFHEVWKALKINGRVLINEPKGHVSLKEFDQTITIAKEVGFIQNDSPPVSKYRKVLLQTV